MYWYAAVLDYFKEPTPFSPLRMAGEGGWVWGEGREVKAQGSWLRTLQRKAGQQEALPLLSQVKWGSWDDTIPEGC